jgi:NAD(P)-dependent dehydrogenase (short-subunit alcohol dehydrogenase family)
MARVMVTGGTGVLGRAVVPRLLADGHEVIVLTRRPAAQVPGGAGRVAGDLARGEGLDAAVTGAEVVVHLASQPFRSARVAVGGTKFLIDPGAGGCGVPGRSSSGCGHAAGQADMARLPGGSLQRGTRCPPAAVYRTAGANPPPMTAPARPVSLPAGWSPRLRAGPAGRSTAAGRWTGGSCRARRPRHGSFARRGFRSR